MRWRRAADFYAYSLRATGPAMPGDLCDAVAGGAMEQLTEDREAGSVPEPKAAAVNDGDAVNNVRFGMSKSLKSLDMDDAVFEILASPSRREALRYLFASGGDVTGRDLARHIGFSHQQAHNALRQLEEYGLVERKVFGPSHLFRLSGKALESRLRALLK